MGPFQRLSLRHKLPLFLVGLTATALVLAGVVAGREVRAASRAAAEERLQRVARELADLTQGQVGARDSLAEAFAADPAVRAALAGRVDSVAVRAALMKVARPNDRGLPVELWSADRKLVYATAPPPPSDPQPQPPLEAERSWSPFHQIGEETAFWMSTPVRSGSRTLGWFAQKERLGSRQTAEALSSLLGNDIQLVIGNRAANSWAWMDGRTFEPPVDSVPTETPFAIQLAGVGPAVAVAAPMPGSPFVIMGEIPQSTIDARPRAFVERMLVVGLLLLVATGMVGWIVSLRLTAPLEGLATAAASLARGQEGRRVPEEGDDELARLAQAFNSMADQVAQHAEALRQRLDEASALAGRLQEANVAAEQAREDAQTANRAKSEFLATMSHEIRTPINAVIGYTDLLAQGIPDPPTEKQRDYLARIERSSRLLIAHVNDLLDFARIESGQLRVQRGVGGAADLIQTARTALEPDAKKKGVRFGTRCAQDLLFQGDPRRVQQIVLNLASNALKFTPRGGSVEILCEPAESGPRGERGDWLRIDVRDTGIGVEQELLGRIFEPFVQGETGFTREHGGVGLGLAISRRLAGLLGGDITVVSEQGKGSCFTLWLPSVPSASTAPFATA